MDDDEHDDEHEGGSGWEDDYSDMLSEQRQTFRHQMPDAFLASLAGTTEDGVVVTVLVGGVWLSGQIVSGATWIASIANASNDDDFSRTVSEWAMEDHARATIDPLEPEEVKILHMAQVRTFTRDLTTTSHIHGATFRCRLSAIDAWFFGTPEAAEEP